jgi:molybdenum cofactor cytidylyltransferase
MRFADALPLGVREVVAFIGAGGKTRAMFRLADELSGQGWRVISTSTYPMTATDTQRVPHRIGLGASMRIPPSLSANLERYRHVFVFTRVGRNDTVRGIRPMWLDDNLATFDFHDIILVEADSSESRSLKAPKPDEPTLPASTSVVVLVVGMDALHASLSDEHVYGAEYIHQWLGHPLRASMSPSMLAATLLHPALGMKKVPFGARVVVVLNKVTDDNRSEARQIARILLSDHRVERVLLGAVQEPDPIHEVQRRTGAIVLAAGQSSRMGHPKMLLPWAGTTVIQHIVKQLVNVGIYDNVVVAGDEKATIADRLEKFPVRLVSNYQGEMFQSIRSGLFALEHTCDAAFIVLGDQPMLKRSVLTQMLEAYAQNRGALIVPSYNEQRGHPILIDRAFWPMLLDMSDDATLRDFLAMQEGYIHHEVVQTPAILYDIDTPEDYDYARRNFEQS